MNKIVSVLAGGWSVRGLPLDSLPGYVIGVNESGVLSPRVDAVVTMDRLWLESRWDTLCKLKRPTWARPAALLNIKERPIWLTVFKCDYNTSEFSETEDTLNGTNSGGCALNLAYQMKPKKVILFGFDMCRSPNNDVYWHAPHPWRPEGGTSETKYSVWAREFDIPAKMFKAAGIDVWNASPVSRIKAFPKINPMKVMGI